MTPEEAVRLLDVIETISWFTAFPAGMVWLAASIKQRKNLLDVFPIGPIVGLAVDIPMGILKVYIGEPAWGIVLSNALFMYVIYRYISNNKNDRWKRFKKRVGERIKAMNGRLVVVPVKS